MENMTADSTIHQLTKELKFTRIICMISSVLTLCLLAGGGLLFSRVQKLAENCEPVVEKVAELDVESLNSTLAYINDSLATVDWEQVADSLGELDVEAVNSVIERLDVDSINSVIERLDVDAINSAIEGLDTRELTEALKNLNDAVEKIREISEKMSEMASRIGGFFNRN